MSFTEVSLPPLHSVNICTLYNFRLSMFYLFPIQSFILKYQTINFVILIWCLLATL